MGAVFTCSIDDGHPSDMKTAELLGKHGLSGTFYVPIRNREDPDVLSNTEIRELGRSFEIGSHTHDHCYLRNLDIWESYHQIADGKRHLEDILGKEVPGFCYPGGRYRRRDLELVRAYGFRYARTIMNLRFDAGCMPYEMPTTIQFYPHDRVVYLRNFVGSGYWHKRIAGLGLAIMHEHWIDRMYALFDHACKHGRTFHLWGHSKQFDELDAWQELDKFLAHVAERVAIGDRLSNAQLAERAFSAPVSRTAEQL